MTPHPRDRVLWRIGAVIHALLVVFELFLYCNIDHLRGQPGMDWRLNALLVMVAASLFLGVKCVQLARVEFRKPPFRRQM